MSAPKSKEGASDIARQYNEVPLLHGNSKDLANMSESIRVPKGLRAPGLWAEKI